MSVLELAVEGGLVGWHGLPGALDAAAVKAQIDADWSAAPGSGERVASSFEILRGTRATPPERVEAWFRAGEHLVSSIEFRPPDGTDHAAILADLGEPELLLGSHQFEAGASVQDRVHAGRGITVSLAEPFDEEDERAPYLVYVQLYGATSTQRYLIAVGQSGKALRPYPR